MQIKTEEHPSTGAFIQIKIRFNVYQTWNRGPQGTQGLLGAAGTAVQVVTGTAPEGGTEGDYLSKCNNSALVKVTCITELHDFNILNKNYRPERLYGSGKDSRPNQLVGFYWCGCLLHVNTHMVFCQKFLRKCYRSTCNIFNNSCMCVCLRRWRTDGTSHHTYM